MCMYECACVCVCVYVCVCVCLRARVCLCVRAHSCSNNCASYGGRVYKKKSTLLSPQPLLREQAYSWVEAFLRALQTTSFTHSFRTGHSLVWGCCCRHQHLQRGKAKRWSCRAQSGPSRHQSTVWDPQRWSCPAPQRWWSCCCTGCRLKPVCKQSVITILQKHQQSINFAHKNKSFGEQYRNQIETPTLRSHKQTVKLTITVSTGNSNHKQSNSKTYIPHTHLHAHTHTHTHTHSYMHTPADTCHSSNTLEGMESLLLDVVGFKHVGLQSGFKCSGWLNVSNFMRQRIPDKRSSIRNRVMSKAVKF